MTDSVKLILIVEVITIFIIFSTAQKAPGFFTMLLSYNLKNSDYSNPTLTLKSVIKQENPTLKVTVYDRTDQFKRKSNQNDKFELVIEFYTDNIKLPISFTGKMSINLPYSTNINWDIRKNILFERNALKIINGTMVMSQTFYNSDYLDEIDVIISAKCQVNYYPENVCHSFCIITKNTKECDKNGNKICERGYSLNQDTKLCDNDWCWQSQNVCLNGGTCVNMENRFNCKCPLFYRGTFCEIYYNACLTNPCPNGTTCMPENDKIQCKLNKSERSLEKLADAKDGTLVISFPTMVVISIAIVVVLIGICVTFWACKKPKEPEFRSSEESMNFKPLSCYNYLDSKCNAHSVPIPTQDHWHCDCKCNDKHLEWACGSIDNYYSFRMPHERVIDRGARPNSDLMMARGGHRRVSRASSVHTTVSNSGADCESLPLPPPIGSENTFSI